MAGKWEKGKSLLPAQTRSGKSINKSQAREVIHAFIEDLAKTGEKMAE